MGVETRAPWSIQARAQALSLKDAAVTQARDVASSRQKTLRPRPIPRAKAVLSTRKQTAAASLLDLTQRTIHRPVPHRHSKLSVSYRKLSLRNYRKNLSRVCIRRCWETFIIQSKETPTGKQKSPQKDTHHHKPGEESRVRKATVYRVRRKFRRNF